MIMQLNDWLIFPDPYLSDDPEGLIAIGGDLSPERLLLAYSLGIFPWFSFNFYEEPRWYCPLDRFVIFPDEIHISHSMRNMMNKGRFVVTFNRDFDGVIRGCAKGGKEDRMSQEGAWLGDDIIEAYTELYRLGFVQSVEVWKTERDIGEDNPEGSKPGKLVGGLYGVSLGSAFFGESMFSEEPGASKLALIHLARKMHSQGGSLIDCQFETPHLKSMGGRHISYQDYLRIIRRPVIKYS